MQLFFKVAIAVYCLLLRATKWVWYSWRIKRQRHFFQLTIINVSLLKATGQKWQAPWATWFVRVESNGQSPCAMDLRVERNRQSLVCCVICTISNPPLLRANQFHLGLRNLPLLIHAEKTWVCKFGQISTNHLQMYGFTLKYAVSLQKTAGFYLLN